MSRFLRRSRRSVSRSRLFVAAAEALENRRLLAGTVSITNQALVEGDSGQTIMNFTVTRTGDLTSAVSVQYATADGTAISGVDYVGQGGAVTIPAGQASAQIAVPIIGDTLDENDENFFVNLLQISDVTGPAASSAGRIAFPAPTSQRGLVSADFNLDGRPDVAVGSGDNATVGVLLNNGSPGGAVSLAAAQQFPAGGTGIEMMLAGDINSDGRPDLITSHWVPGRINILLNTTTPGSSTPSFAAPQGFNVVNNAVALALGDINRDGRTDIVVGSLGSGISVFTNLTATGGGAVSLSSRLDINTSGHDQEGVKVADLNNDGAPEIVASQRSPSTELIVLRNTTAPGASASFATAQKFVTTNGGALDVADINGDGRLDFAHASDGATASVFTNATSVGSSTFAFNRTILAVTGKHLTFGDINGDFRPDLLVLAEPQSTLTRFINRTVPGSTTPSFVVSPIIDPGTSTPDSVEVQDLNSDGRPDIIIGDVNDGIVSVYTNNATLGAATQMPAFPQTAFNTGQLPHTAALGDINNDGRGDLVVVNQNSFTVSILLNTTAAGSASITYAAKQDFPVQSFPDWVDLADLNGDGKLDMAISNGFSDSISIFLNTTAVGSNSVTFSTRQDFAVGSLPRSVVAGDFNTDGRPDLAVANFNSDTISVFFNTTSPGAAALSLATRQDFTVGDGPTALDVADFNNDGRPDLAIAHFNANTVSVLNNLTPPGSTTPFFAPLQSFAVNAGPRGVAAGDVNNDGRPDLVVANAGPGETGTTVSTLLNTTAAGAGVSTFEVKQHTIVNLGPISIAAGDVNGDGRVDFSVASFGGNTLTVMLNQTAPGSSSPQYLVEVFASGTRPIFTAIGDANGDGRPELTSANFESNTASVFLNSPFVITGNLAIGTIIDNDFPVVASFSPITTSPLLVRWQPVQISAAAIANDPALANMRTFDLIVTTTTDWTSAGVRVTLPGGATFYNNATGNTAPDPSLIVGNPALAFDTYVTGPGGFGNSTQILGGFVGGFPSGSATFGPTDFSVSWGDAINSGPGDFQIARLTLSASALNSGGTPSVSIDSRVIQSDGSPQNTAPVPALLQTYLVNESGAAILFPIRLAAPAPSNLVLSVSVVGGTAINGVDYTAPTTIVIPQGQSIVQYAVNVINDLIDEADETIFVQLNSGAGYTATGTILSRVTITDNDPPPLVTVQNLTRAEDAGTVSLSVGLQVASAQDVSISFAVGSSTASLGVDYLIDTASPLVIPAGATSGSINITIINDTLDEPSETAVILLTGAANATLPVTPQLALTITDDDPPPLVRFTQTAATMQEGVAAFQLNIELSVISAQTVTVPLVISSASASIPDDFTLTPAVVTIPAGATGGFTTIAIVDDQHVELTETATIQVSPALLNGSIGTPSSFELTILDNEVRPMFEQGQFLFATAPHRLEFRFNTNVGASLTATDLVLENLTGGTVVPPASMSVVFNASTNTATFTFPGVPNGVLADGNYRARIAANAVTDAGGNPLAGDVLFNFFHLTGDADHDRTIGLADFAFLAANFNRPGNFTVGDFNYSGFVELGDFSLLASRFNTTLPAPRAAIDPLSPRRIFGDVLVQEPL